MSRERARRREARERATATRAQPAVAGRPGPRAQRRPGARRRRYGALPTRTVVGLAAGWLAVQVAAWQLGVPGRVRLGLALLTAAALPPFVVLFVPRRARPRSLPR